MKLFDDKARSREQPLKQGEPFFGFYDQCIQPGYHEFRSTLNAWLEMLPEADQRELVSRMKGDNREFQAGLAELLTHATLWKLGLDLAVHPNVVGTNKRPDFGIVDKEKLLGLIEVTTINVADANARQSNREAVLYNAINRVGLPAGCLLGYELIYAGQNSPKTAALVKSIEDWAEQSVAEAKKSGGPITSRFKADDWEVEVDLFAGGSKEKYDNSIGIVSGGAGWIAPHLDLRKALELKSKRYGVQPLPFLLVVGDAKGQLFGANSVRSAVTEAVLGDEVVQWRKEGGAKVINENNGFWRGNGGPRNRHVSGVLLFPDVGIWGLRSEQLQPVLAINPWADHSIPDRLRRLSHFESEKDKWVFKQGENIADILEFPTPWPPES